MRRIAALLIAFGIISISIAEQDWRFDSVAAPIGAAVADSVPVVAGETPPIDAIYFIKEPGRYGLGPDIPGSRYAIVSGTLVRLDGKTNKILSILRSGATILD